MTCEFLLVMCLCIWVEMGLLMLTFVCVCVMCRYAMIFVYPVLYFGYKIVRKTKIRKPEEVDLLKDVAEIEEYQNNYIPTPPRYVNSQLISVSSRYTMLTISLGMDLKRFSTVSFPSWGGQFRRCLVGDGLSTCILFAFYIYEKS
jgi:hypothetical protein